MAYQKCEPFPRNRIPLRKEFMLELVTPSKLQSPQLAAVVTQFRVKPPIMPCKHCICSDIDGAIRHFIQLTVNMEVLDITCAMDLHPQSERHNYFTGDQGIRCLRCVSFKCGCGS